MNYELSRHSDNPETLTLLDYSPVFYRSQQTHTYPWFMQKADKSVKLNRAPAFWSERERRIFYLHFHSLPRMKER